MTVRDRVGTLSTIVPSRRVARYRRQPSINGSGHSSNFTGAITAGGTGSKLDEFGVTAIEDTAEKLPSACLVTMANPVERSSFGNAAYSHFFQRKNRYGTMAAASIMTSAIG